MSLARPSAAQQPADTLPPTARAIALLLASTPTVQDAQPGVLHQLLEFSHRYTAQVLSDAQVYAEHAGRSGSSKIEMDDVVLAIQARVGWEFGGRVPKEYILSLASQTNATPLPSVPEIFGVRLPPSSETLTAVNFDLVPNKPPPDTKLYDEEVEEIEEEDEELPDGQDDDEDADMEPAAIPYTNAAPITPTDVDIAGTPAPVVAAEGLEENSDAEEADGLFGAEGDDDDDNSGDDAMEEVQTTGDTQTNGVKRKLIEEDDYD
ncbi:transcription initiation factor IID, 31kD subunit-domain-containing protein [Suillus ampliporus]|nr:transcription initiation factor IID, 31kD subunit-domain-containing protein [Suillus ampliporus]